MTKLWTRNLKRADIHVDEGVGGELALPRLHHHEDEEEKPRDEGERLDADSDSF